MKLCCADWKGFEAINVPGRQISIEDLLNLMIDITGAGHFEVKEFPKHVQTIDVGDSVLCGDKLKSLIGGWPTTELKKALQETIQYFRGRYEL